MNLLSRRILSWLLGVLIVMTPFTTSQAAMIGTDQVLGQQAQPADRDQIRQFMERDSVRQQLLDWGVSVDDVQTRINSLSEAEVARINQAIDNPQAGGSSILGILLVIFIVFVITDVIGATDIFPFIHPVN